MARAKIIGIVLALVLTSGLGLGMRCLSAGDARCSFGNLTGNAPKLDVPYAETRMEAVEKMLDMAGVGPGDHVIDLGTGDGRMLIQASARGAGGLGVDIDPTLVARARASAVRRGVANRVTFQTQDLFDTPLAGADVVTMFLLPEINLKLRPRLLEELNPGARVISHAFTMDDWKPDRVERVGGSRLYLWVIPADISGAWRLRDARGERLLTVEQRFQTFAGQLEGDHAVYDGRVTGDQFSFTVREGERSVQYEGRVEGDTLVGTAPSAWTAHR